MFKNIAILYKENDELAHKTAEKLKKWFKQKGFICSFFHPVGASIKLSTDEVSIIHKADVVVVLGGDGTILSASRIIEGRKIPIIGINMGTLGFMTEIPKTELFETLDRIFSGEYEIEQRSMIRTQVIRQNSIVVDYLGLNDTVIGKAVMARIAVFDLMINNTYVSSIRADGIIISTPTGSTAYNLSAGGPILFPTLKGLVFTPICPHTLTVRPVVLPDDFVIEIILSSDIEVFLTVDGQINFPLKKADRVKCFIAEEKTYIIAPVGRDYFKILREKLKWG